MYEDEFKLVESTILEAGEILKKYYGSIDTYKIKRDHTLVSKADQESEELIRSKLLEAYPKSSFIGEETGKRPGQSGYKREWAVDPLDGTTNFLHKIPHFCISIGMAYEGEWVLGMIYNPITGEIFTGKKGEGSFCGKHQMKASTTTNMKEAFVVFGRGFSSIYKEPVHEVYKKFSRIRAARSMGSAALDLAFVADGRFDLHFCKGLHIWDTAAAYVLLKEAGAQVQDFSGKEYDPSEANVVAGNQALIEEIRPLLEKV